jgi:hypothetical protein
MTVFNLSAFAPVAEIARENSLSSCSKMADLAEPASVCNSCNVSATSTLTGITAAFALPEADKSAIAKASA